MLKKLLVIVIFSGVWFCERSGGNLPPLAITEKELKTYINEPVRLDGTKSMDPDGDRLVFQWEVNSAPGGSLPVLADAETATPLFIGNVEGKYEITLIVSDGKENSKPETVTILVFADNMRPLAEGGDTFNIRIDEEVELNAGMSADPMNRPLTFTWEITKKPDGSSASLSNTQGVSTRFKPDIPHATYEITLIVDNGLYSNKDTVFINVLNTPPVAEPGKNQFVHPGGFVNLIGSGHDRDGDEIVGYSWEIREQPGNGYFSDSSSKTPIFYTDSVPSAQGDYIIELKVYDGTEWSEPSIVVVSTVNAPPNIIIEDDYRQVAHCYGGEIYFATNASDTLCTENQIPVLKLVSFVEDPENDPLTSQWTVVTKPPSAPDPIIRSPGSFQTDVDIRSSSAVITGDYTFRITVTDIYGASSTKDVKISVTNRPPRDGGVPGSCNLSFTRSGCTYSELADCYTSPVVSFEIDTKAIDPDNDPLFNEYYYAGLDDGMPNCVYSHGVKCGSNKVCKSTAELRGYVVFGCSSSITWEGTTYIRVKFTDEFGAVYDDNVNDCTITVNCSTCN